MDPTTDPSLTRRPTFALKCALVYLAAGVLWIALSDRAVEQLPPAVGRAAQTYKGWAYVGVTAAVLFWAVRRFERRVAAAERAAAAARAALEGRVRAQGAQLESATAVARQTNQDLEALADSVARDLRAPLRAITGFADIVHRRYTAGAGDPDAVRYVEHIRAAADQMTALVDDLGAYTALSAAHVRRDPVGLDQVVAHALDSLAARVRETGARVEVVGPLPAVTGERTLLRQAVTCLLDNALKFTRPGVPPAVTVSAAPHGEADGHVTLCVRDDGIGIDPEHHPRLFRPFRRLHTQDEYPGAGLGLASVRRAAAMMGGSVSIDSAPGQGSTFRLTLPRA